MEAKSKLIYVFFRISEDFFRIVPSCWLGRKKIYKDEGLFSDSSKLLAWSKKTHVLLFAPSTDRSSKARTFAVSGCYSLRSITQFAKMHFAKDTEIGNLIHFTQSVFAQPCEPPYEYNLNLGGFAKWKYQN